MGTHSSNAGSAGATGHGERLPVAVVEDLLDSPRHRRLLGCLIDRDGPVVVADLATELAAAESTAGQVSAADRRRVRMDLFQDLLPPLMAAGVVSFDSRLGTVEFTGPDTLAARLSAMSDTHEESGTKDK